MHKHLEDRIVDGARREIAFVAIDDATAIGADADALVDERITGVGRGTHLVARIVYRVVADRRRLQASVGEQKLRERRAETE